MLPRQDLFTLELPDALLRKLLTCYATTFELEGATVAQLVQDARLTPLEAQQVLGTAATRQTKAAILQGGFGAADLARQDRGLKIVTFCQPLDMLLAGGIATGQVTELCGVPGVGKTQLGMQLAIDVQFHKTFSGLMGSAIYIDTEGGFAVDRARQIAQAAVSHLARIAKGSTSKKQYVDSLRPETLLDSINLFRPHSFDEMCYVLDSLPDFIEQQRQEQLPLVRLVVLDSLACHLRGNNQNGAERTRTLFLRAQYLHWLAEHFDVAVVLVNHMTTKVIEGQDARIVPALGDSWAHACTTRLTLSWRGNSRYAEVTKSPTLPCKGEAFLVDSHGFRGRMVPQKRKSSAQAP